MKIQKYELKTISTKLLKIDECTFIAKNGNKTTTVSLKTPDGIFINYISVWEKIGLNEQSLPYLGDVEITYAEKVANGKIYKNYVSITPVNSEISKEQNKTKLT